MVKFIQTLINDVRGATAVEYGLIMALIVLGCVGAITSVARSTTGLWNNVSDAANKS